MKNSRGRRRRRLHPICGAAHATTDPKLREHYVELDEASGTWGYSTWWHPDPQYRYRLRKRHRAMLAWVQRHLPSDAPA